MKIIRSIVMILLLAACSSETMSRPDFRKTDSSVRPEEKRAVLAAALDGTTPVASGTNIPLLSATADQICTSVTFRDSSGTVRTGRRLCDAPKTCSLNGEKNCVAGQDFPAFDITGMFAKNLAKVHQNLTIFDITGTMAPCDTLGQKNCYVSLDTVAIDPLRIDPTKLLAGYSVLGVTGTLPDCVAGTVEHNCLASMPLKVGPVCADGDSNCFIRTYASPTDSLKAFNVTTLVPEHFKSGYHIAGIVGAYPSVAFPLDGSADGHADLSSAAGAGGFVAQLSDPGTVGWFDRTGTRYTQAGDANLVSTNIVVGHSIFGINGDIVLPDPKDVRAGTSVGVTTGSLKMNCRNGYDLGTFDIGIPKIVSTVTAATDVLTVNSHGFSTNDTVQMGFQVAPSPLALGVDYYAIVIDADHIKLAASSGGAAIDITTAGSDVSIMRSHTGTKGYQSAIDDQNGNGALVTSLTGASDPNFCDGITPTNTDGIWKDVTPSGCNSLSSECVYEDQITGLQWSQSSSVQSGFSVASWGLSIATCSGLTFAGHSDWRLPTQKEWMSASIHNMRSVHNSLWVEDFTTTVSYWTSTAVSQSGSVQSWSTTPGTGDIAAQNREQSYSIMCVRP